jgi:hypothetical protein
MAQSNDICSHCGAPRVPGFAACKYCKAVFPREAQTSVQDNAVPCPKCQTLNEWGAQRCVQCQTWVVVQCVFCQAISPHHIPACLGCNEAFAGAPERLAMRQQEQTSQQRMQIAGTVGSVAASFLGALAGSALSGGVGHAFHHDSHHHRRESWSGAEEGWRHSGSSLGNDASVDDAGGGGGGLLDALTGGGSDDSGDTGGGGGGLMDDLLSGGSSGDD